MCTNDYGESVSQHLAGVADAYGSLESNDDDRDCRVEKYLKYIDGFKQFYPNDDDWIDLKFTHFDDLESVGIPTFSKHFKNYNVALKTGGGGGGVVDGQVYYDEWDDCETYDHDHRSRLIGTLPYYYWTYVYDYVNDPHFKSRSMLTNRERDHIVYGIFAFILLWPEEDILKFASFFPRVSALVSNIVECIRTGAVVDYKGLPVMPSTFKVLKMHFQHDLCDDDAVVTLLPVRRQPYFSIKTYVKRTLSAHFHKVYACLQNEYWGPPGADRYRDITHVNETFGVPFAQLLGSRTNPAPPSAADLRTRPKYVTGVACSGKTSALNALRRYGWTIKSRGDLGTFGGKSKSPAYVAALHAALDYAYRAGAPYVIGDRGPIDNPLWTAITEMCNPRYARDMVYRLEKFFEHTFNELVIRYHGEFDVVVFLDPYPSRNRERMLKRGENGDAYRGRLRQYVAAQFMAYFMFAVLFGHRIVLVPYDDDRGNFDENAHVHNTLMLADYYGHADPIPGVGDGDVGGGGLGKISKLLPDVPDFLQDNKFSVMHGIFK
ncbi:hypothetical protein AGLY_017854 [Aphis glycines]|uniref:Uncharacterized protein n=1 Tax=Aphis glycines TaxID=307491 RepID=A0A6G0STQ8_APHGL|nr:hypothetical protein AGLY_017854 [Aphis glycines]